MLRIRSTAMVGLTTAILLSWPLAAQAQMRGSSGNFGGSSFGGSSFGGSSFGGSSFGGSSFGGSSFGGSSFGGSSFGGNSFGSNSFSGGFGGNSFSGGFSGNSFGGNSFSGGSFSGNSFSGSFSGNSFAGNNYGGRGANNPDPFAASRANPLAMGQYGGMNTSTTGMYGGNMQGAGQLGGIMGTNRFGNNMGMNNMGNMSGMNANSANNNVRQPGFVLRPAFTAPPVVPTEVTARLQKVLSSSPSLPSGSKITFATDGEALVLRGQVATEDEKHLAEAIARLEPGVYAVKNELQVGSTPAPPEPKNSNARPGEQGK